MKKIASRKRTGRKVAFILSKYTDCRDFQKLGYVAGTLGLNYRDIAKMISESPDVVENILQTGNVSAQLPNTEEIFDKLYMLLMMFSSLLRLTHYSDDELKHLFFSDTAAAFEGCKEQPPWYPTMTLRDYIQKGGLASTRSATQWLRTH